MINVAVVVKLVRELAAQGAKFKGEYHPSFTSARRGTYPDSRAVGQWRTQGLNALRSTLPETSPYAAEFDKWSGNDSYGEAAGVLDAAAADLESGMALSNLRTLLEAEVAGDHLEQAENLLKEGYKDPAAVIVGTVLEHHLRSVCSVRNLPTSTPDGKPLMMAGLRDVLAKAGVITALQKRNVEAWGLLRNSAAHGKYGDYVSAEVQHMLTGVRDFCDRVT